jgi:hypothetical protein
VVRGWFGVREALRADGREGFASEVERFLKNMPPPQTEREWLAQALLERAQNARQQMQIAATR